MLICEIKEDFELYYEEEDYFDGVLPGDFSAELEAYNESLDRDVGELWEDTV